MKKPGRTVPYLALLLLAVAAVLSFDLIHHLGPHRSSAAAFHGHLSLSLSQAAIILFCGMFYIADRLKLFHLSLRLCFLSLFLVWARVLFDLQTGRFSANTIETALLVFAGIVLLALTRHPVRMLEKEQLPS